ncbi:MAG: leucyl aminopeptidase [Sulfobacillus acidophilus]|uniref:Probable cytosol aminopeptidase n=1 Tax=Sulfobacillus acidophilus TaxID=53633 RepID=A0A2T2WIS4_9FIRM|nr:MAG: leucyl aminopeptidase [Sulfobacillus acidophilus]
MSLNRWTQASAMDHVRADVWIVEAQEWKHLNPSSTVKLPDAAPTVVFGTKPGAAIVTPLGSTRRKTQKNFRQAAQLAVQLKPERIGVQMGPLTSDMLRAALWGIGQGLYRFRQEDAEVQPEVTVVSNEALTVEFAILQHQDFVRDWVNCPSNLKPPVRLAKMMQDRSPDTIEWSLFDQKALVDMGAGGVVGVGQGSHRPPVMLIGKYAGKPGDPWIALVGKGIVFDSGGISIKPGEGMGRMKGDMGGAAAVAGALRAIADLKVPANVMAVLPLAENLPGGGAYRPGDILTMMDGTQVEIVSTDAEGRLVLADAVTWARQNGAAVVIDMATLTGANVVALGGIRSALVTNHQPLASLVAGAAERAAEPAWQLPHDEDYADFNQTSAADIKNSGGRPAGTITAGLFIGHFAGDTPWVHLDIAGLSFEAEGSAIGAGATGYGVALLVETVEAWSHSSKAF